MENLVFKRKKKFIKKKNSFMQQKKEKKVKILYEMVTKVCKILRKQKIILGNIKKRKHKNY